MSVRALLTAFAALGLSFGALGQVRHRLTQPHNKAQAVHRSQPRSDTDFRRRINATQRRQFWSGAILGYPDKNGVEHRVRTERGG